MIIKRNLLVCLIVLIVVSCHSNVKTESQERVDVICSIFEEGTKRAEQATSSKELYDLTFEVRARVRKVGANEADFESLSDVEANRVQRIAIRYYNALENRHIQLTGHRPKWNRKF